MGDEEAIRDASERAALVWLASLRGEITSAEERKRRLEEIASGLTPEQQEAFWEKLPVIRDQTQAQVTRERAPATQESD